MLENGIKPVYVCTGIVYVVMCTLAGRYVFDGKPPELKSGELLKRTAKRTEAEKDLAQATEQGLWPAADIITFQCCVTAGDQDKMEKFQKRLVSGINIVISNDSLWLV